MFCDQYKKAQVTGHGGDFAECRFEQECRAGISAVLQPDVAEARHVAGNQRPG